MKKLIIILAAVLAGYTGFAQCNAPVINSFSPNTGFIGSTVTIIGAYFETTPANNVVYFGATKAVVTSASFGTLTVTVPVGATTAPISVTNSCSKTAYSAVSFNGIFCPTPITTTTYQNTAVNLTGIYGAYNMLSQDMDLDGKPDVISGGTGGVTVAKNNSTPGTLAFSAVNLAGGGSSLAVADLDGDGKREIINPGRIYRNLSTPGTLSFTAQIGIGLGGYQVAAGDFNNDGLIDVITESGNQMYILRNTSTGPGSISFAAAVAVGNVGSTCTGLQVADVDGDGKTDIVGSQGNANRATSLRNTTTPGSATFSFESPEFWPSNGNYPYRCQVADFDKDGKIDLTTCNYNPPANTCIFRNTSVVGNISFATSVNLAAPQNNYRIQVGDVNGDGLPDIVTKSLGVNVFSVYPNTSTGPGSIAFGTRFDYTSSAMAEVSGIAIGDLDGDFVPDIATSGISSNAIRFHRNTSSQVDITAPTAICKNITVALSPTGTATVTAAMIDNGSSDACGIGSLLINNSASVTFTCADIGANTVTLKVIDRANNSSTCTAVVTVAPAAIIVAGQTTVCQGQTVTLTANTGDTYQWAVNGNNISGATSQTYVATASGNYTVTVTNSGGCSGTSSATTVTVNNNPTVNITPSGVTSLCSGSAVLTASTSSVYQWKLNGNNISGATQQIYTATATGNYTVTVIDLFGCTASSGIVAVNNTPPEIDITGNSNSIADGDNTPSATDGTDFGTTGSGVSTFTVSNSGTGNLVVSAINITGSGASAFTVGGISLPATIAPSSSATFTVTYSSSVLGTSNAVVAVQNNDCNEAAYDFAVKGELNCTTPAFSACPGTTNANTAANTCDASVNYTVTATGIPSPTLSYAFSGATSGSGTGSGSGATFGLGSTTVTVTATNTCGSATCSFTVVVTDSTPPSVSTQNDTIYLDSAGNGSITVSDIDNGSTDACGIDSRSLSKTSFSCSDVGANTVTLTVTDNNTNSATGTATVTVIDNIAPVVSTQNYTLYLSSGGTGSVAASDIDNGSTDACGIASRSLNTTSFSCSDVGVNTVTLTVTDNNGNTNTGTATVTVVDNTAPSVTTQNITINLDASGAASITPAQVDNGSADACGIASRSLSKTSFSCADVGSNTVTLTVTDNNSNTNTGTATVTVVDNTAPSVITQNMTIYLDASGAASITPAQVDNGSADACGIASRSLSKTSFSCAEVGSNTVTLTVTDNNSNSNTGTATVLVRDTIKPVAICKNVTVTLSGAAASVTAAQVNNGSNDACGIASLSVSPSTFNCSNIGNNSATLTVTDNNGNVSTCTATVNVVGAIPTVSISEGLQPGFTQGGAIVLTASSPTAIGYSWTGGPATNQYYVYASGTYTVTATNSYGCTVAASKTVSYTAANLLSSYVIIGRDEVELDDHITVYNGGVGVTSTCGEADIEDHSTITASGTFVRAKDIDVSGSSSVSTKLYTAVPTSVLPTFLFNPYCSSNSNSCNHSHHNGCNNHSGNNSCNNNNSSCNHSHHSSCSNNYGCNHSHHNSCSGWNCSHSHHNSCGSNNSSSNNKNVNQNATVTITDSIMGQVVIGKNATVTFTAARIYMKGLEVKEGANVKFTQCAVIRVCNHVDFQKNVSFNTVNSTIVSIYVEDKFDVDGGSEVTANVYSKDKVSIKGKSSDPTVMKGLFIGDEVKAEKYVKFYWNTSVPCGNNNYKVAPVEPVADEMSLIRTYFDVNAYPNPTVHNFSLRLFSSSNEPFSVSVYDLTGKLIETRKVNESDLQMEMGENYARGLYLIQVTQGENTKTLRLVKADR